MSGMFGRFTNIVKAKMHRAMSEAEDPAEMLDYSFEKQMEMLQKVRRGIAEVATSKARIQGQLARLMEQDERLDGQARQALTLGEYLAHWLETVKRHQVRPSTYRSYCWQVRTQILPRLGISIGAQQRK